MTDLNLLKEDLSNYYDYVKENDFYSLTNHNDISSVFEEEQNLTAKTDITKIFWSDILFWERNIHDRPYDMVIFSYFLKKWEEERFIDIIPGIEAYTYFKDKEEYLEYMLWLVEKRKELKGFLEK